MPSEFFRTRGYLKKKVWAKRLQSEQGSALVLVMFVVLLLTILGLSVLSAAVGGAQRTETRKNDVQSLHLAEKSLDEGVAYITANLNNLISNSADMSQEQVEFSIQTYLSSLNQREGGLPTTTALLQAASNVKAVYNSTTESPNQYEITLTAEAEVNGVVRNLRQLIYIDTFPDFLNYTLGSEGDLIINGSPWISGNIYAGGTLKLDKQVNYKYQGNSNILTSRSFELVNGGEAHVQSLDKLEYYYSDDRNPRTAEQTLGQPIESGMIPQQQIKIKSKRQFVEVNIEDSFIDKVSEAMKNSNDTVRQSIRTAMLGGTLAEYLNANSTMGLVGLTEEDLTQPVLTDDTPEAEEAYDTALVDYNANINLLTSGQLEQSVIYHGDLTLNDSDLSRILYKQKEDVTGNKKWFIVDGDLTIESFDANKPVQISANMLITGRVTIRGQAQFDSTIYVLESGANSADYTTTVEDAEITGLNNKQLVLLSRGPILFNRLKAFDTTVTPIAGFFYTDSSADLYGVGSIFSLKGGFFAKGDLTINAVRGNAEARNGQIVIDTATNILRFKAEYDNTVFTAQNAGLPRVKSIKVQVGNLELQ